MAMILITFLRINYQIGTFSAAYTCVYILFEEFRALPSAFPLATQPCNEKRNGQKREAIIKQVKWSGISDMVTFLFSIRTITEAWQEAGRWIFQPGRDLARPGVALPLNSMPRMSGFALRRLVLD